MSKANITRSAVQTDEIRVQIGRWVRIALTICAAALAVGAILFALRSNLNINNFIVDKILGFNNFIAGSVFDKAGGLWDFDGKGAATATKNALANWGTGSVVYLFAGRILERLIRG